MFSWRAESCCNGWERWPNLQVCPYDMCVAFFNLEAHACKLMNQLVSAVSHIHRKLAVHRDLKPENIIFANNSDDAELKLVDFGFARLLPNNSIDLNTPCFTLEVFLTYIKMNKQLLSTPLRKYWKSKMNFPNTISNVICGVWESFCSPCWVERCPSMLALRTSLPTTSYQKSKLPSFHLKIQCGNLFPTWPKT